MGIARRMAVISLRERVALYSLTNVWDSLIQGKS